MFFLIERVNAVEGGSYDSASALHDAESEKRKEVDQSSGNVDRKYGIQTRQIMTGVLVPLRVATGAH
jgi:hypothetical protein